MLVLTVRCSLDLSTELSELSTEYELRAANILAKFFGVCGITNSWTFASVRAAIVLPPPSQG